MSQSYQHVDAALTVASVPAGNLKSLEMRWAKRVFVDAKKSRFTMGVDRSVVDATRNGRSYARAEGAAYPRVGRDSRTTVQGKTVEHSPADDLDYSTRDRAQDPFQPEVIKARKVNKVVLLERYVEAVELVTTTSNWDAACTVALAALGEGASGVQLSDASSLPYVDLEIAARRCASLNDGVRPHFVLMNEVAAGYILAKGGRTSIPVDKPVRELTLPEFEQHLSAHLLGMDVYVESAREAGTLLFPAVIVFGYYPTDVVPTEEGFDVAPSTMVLVHEKIPSLGITGELVTKRIENAEKTGLVIVASSSWVAQKVDGKAIFILTAVY